MLRRVASLLAAACCVALLATSALGVTVNTHAERKLEAAAEDSSRMFEGASALAGVDATLQSKAAAYVAAEVEAAELLAKFERCVAACGTKICIDNCASNPAGTAAAAAAPAPAPATDGVAPAPAAGASTALPSTAASTTDANGAAAAPSNDDSGITIVNNVNTLNVGGKSNNGNGNGNGVIGEDNNGGNPTTSGSTTTGNGEKCTVFWQRNGCQRPKIANPTAETATCDGSADGCTKACCQDPINYGSCGNFFTQKGCPTSWERKQGSEQTGCDVAEVCQGRCCKPQPYTCATFWGAKNCDPRTHERFGGRDTFQCDPTSTHCVAVCCTPKTITCPTYFEVYKQCPPVFRPNGQGNACIPGFEWGRGDACFRRCCNGIEHGQGRCTTWGDPHMITWDNNRFDCHFGGEFVLYENQAKDEAVHNDQIKNPNLGATPPFNVGMAFRAGTDIISVNMVPPSWETFQVHVRFNKKLIPYPDHEIQYGPFILYPVGTLPSPDAPANVFNANQVGLSILNTRTGTGVALWWNICCGTQRYTNIDIAMPDQGEKGRMVSKGQCGTWNGNPADDLVGSGGQVCNAQNADNCCNSWMVPRDRSLFAHAPAQGQGAADGIAQICQSSTKLAEAKAKCMSVAGLHSECVTEICGGDALAHLQQEIKQALHGQK